MANSVSCKDKTHGRPSKGGLAAFTESFVRFLEQYPEENEETAIPGKEAAVSRKQEAVAVLHLHDSSTSTT